MSEVARISCVSNMRLPRTAGQLHGREGGDALARSHGGGGGRGIAEEALVPRRACAEPDERGDGFTRGNHERVADREDPAVDAHELDDVGAAFDAVERELAGFVTHRGGGDLS